MFAGFNSDKHVKGRLQAALYSMRKNRLERQAAQQAEEEPPPEPPHEEP